MLIINIVVLSPYGIDFPNGPTGRWTNGKTAADIIGKLLGLKNIIPSFLTANDSEILNGVNYASGSSGILDETGKHAGENVDMNKQLKNHQAIISRIINIFGRNESAAYEHLNKCLYVVVTGSNDYINNYFMPNNYNSSRMYSPPRFANVLIKQFAQQLRQLYNFGARKVGLHSISSVGCTPNATALYGTNNSICVDHMNFAVNFFNRRLTPLVLRLNSELKNATFIQVGSLGYDPATITPGVNVTLTTCCKLNELGYCIPNQRACHNRNLAIFWDAFHPTEIVNQIAARAAFVLLKHIL